MESFESKINEVNLLEGANRVEAFLATNFSDENPVLEIVAEKLLEEIKQFEGRELSRIEFQYVEALAKRIELTKLLLDIRESSKAHPELEAMMK